LTHFVCPTASSGKCLVLLCRHYDCTAFNLAQEMFCSLNLLCTVHFCQKLPKAEIGRSRCDWQRAGSTAEHAKNGLYSSISSVAKRVFRQVTAGNTEIKAEIPACTSTSCQIVWSANKVVCEEEAWC